MEENKTYIAEIKKIIPKQYSTSYIADKFYPIEKYGQTINQLSKRLANSFKIAERACVLDLEKYPNFVLKNDKDHPLNWGVSVINQLTNSIEKKDIGFFSVSYNVSFHVDTLPNLATQIAMSSGLNHLDKVEEIPNYGCAASIYSLENAVMYCKEYDRPAIVFTFDQCFEKCFQLDKNDDDFKKTLITNLLFSDGGVGLLIIPERMKNNFDHSLMRIKDIMTKYKMGNLIYMKKQRFIMSSDLKNIMPKLVSDILLKPFLEAKKLRLESIEEWSIHQGGSAVIKQFCKDEILGLSEKQIERSLNNFYRYGNVSSASCLLVLESFFNDPKKNKQKEANGVVLGFGAGYYLGVILYDWKA